MAVMSEVPKIVYDRLRATATAGPHPDADMLTAFAEQCLSNKEREGVLAHLAVCQDCRETVALSLPALDVSLQGQSAAEPVIVATTNVIQPTAPIRRDWFAWANLRWAAMAAGIVVVASVLLLRPGKPTGEPADASLHQAAESTPAASGEIKTETKAEVSSAGQPTGAASADQRRRSAEKTRSSDTYEVAANNEPVLHLQEGPAAGLKKQSPEPGRVLGAPVNDNGLLDAAREDSVESSRLALNAPKPAARGAAAATPAAHPADSSTQSVEVSGALASVEVQPEQRLMAENRAEVAAIQKAKPAKNDGNEKDAESRQLVAKTKSEALGASSNYAFSVSAPVHAQWRISEGSLQRSINAGASWDTVLRSDQKLLCQAVRGNEIWVGGRAGTLYFSNNGGITWTLLHPAPQDEPNSDAKATADITNIELGLSGAIAFTTQNGESWTSVDQGKTWARSTGRR